MEVFNLPYGQISFQEDNSPFFRTKILKTKKLNNNTYSNKSGERIPETYLESSRAYMMEIFCAFRR